MIPSSSSIINKKRKCLSFETKLHIIQEVKRGNKAKADICQDYRMSQVPAKQTCRDSEKDNDGLRGSENLSKRE